jgi:hypothetical protein
MARVIFCAFVALVALASGCSDVLSPSVLPGTYVLESVTGRGPSGGTFVLAASGTAERRVHYASATEYVAVGTYRTDADTIRFALRENNGQSEYVWQVRGILAGDRFSIRHPDPADGPDIVETYRRR